MIVNNLNTLKAMEKKGFIKFCDQTGEKITTLYSNKTMVCYYIDEGDSSFTYKGKKYGVKYLDGCFYPFVVELPSNENIFIGL